jgi:hypothetical protein
LESEAYDTPTNRNAAAIGKAAARSLRDGWFVGSRINPCAYVGAFSSSAIQPAETVFIGSLATVFVKL